MSWRPILDGALAERARLSIQQISLRLRAATRDGAPTADLAGGSAGVALFFAYLSELGGTDEDAADAVRLLEESVRALSRGDLGEMLHGGFSGIAWAVEHVAGEEGEEDPNLAVDEALLRMSGDEPNREFDLVNGLSGLLVYAVERLPRASARECIDRFVLGLEELSIGTELGRTWNVPLYDPKEVAELAGSPLRKLGAAHGVAGAIGALAAVCRGVEHEPARRLLEQAVAWLLAQRCEPGSAAEFPMQMKGDAAEVYSRQGWCVGDPGIATTLLSAADALGRADWRDQALEVGLAAARRRKSAGVRELGLCHGAAGLAHLFNRLHQATGEAALAEASRQWFTAALDRYDGETGPLGLLNGAAGVGLALLAGLTDEEPLWDRVLAVAVPPR